ncbi:MAG: 4Fe-4S cluster-binding domain-containing protein, partial [Candidatus Shapirobacteria bacterium]
MSQPLYKNIDDSELIANQIVVRDLMFFASLSCNLRCKTCYVGNKWLNSGLSFSKEEGLSLIHHFATRGLDRLTFLGGEPFV